MATHPNNPSMPAFATPNRLELRPLQQALDNIRESLGKLDARLSATTLATSQTTVQVGQGNSSTADLRRQITQLRTDLDALAALIAAQEDSAPPAPAVVFMDDGEDGQDGMPGAAGVAGAAGAAGAAGPAIFMDDGEDGQDGMPGAIVYDSTRTLDGGSASSVFLVVQQFNGGGA